MKRCSRCGKEKPVEEYYKTKTTKDGYYSHCKSCHLIATTKWDTEHPEKRKEISHKSNVSKEYRQKDSIRSKTEHRKEQFSRFEKTNKGKTMRQNQLERRRVRMNNAKSTLTSKEWREIVASYDGRCVYCNQKADRLTQDHIVPITRGGTHTADNVVPACGSCNSSKYNNPLIVWMRSKNAVQPHEF